MSEFYSDWCFLEIPLSPFDKGGTIIGLERFQHDSCNKNGCRSESVTPFQKGGQVGFFTVAETSNRNIFMIAAIKDRFERFTIHSSGVAGGH